MLPHQVMDKLTVANKKTVRQEFDGLVIQGQKVGESWLKFYYDLDVWLKGSVSVNGTMNYTICGFPSWTATVEHVAEKLRESFSSIKNKLGILDVVIDMTPDEVDEIGKVNLYEMKKLDRAGLLRKDMKDKFKVMSVDAAKAFTAKTLGNEGATPRKIAMLVEEGQWREFMEARERIRQVTGNGSTRDFVGFWLGYLASLSDEELAAAWEGEGG